MAISIPGKVLSIMKGNPHPFTRQDVSQNQLLPPALQSVYRVALRHHGAGQLAKAERCYRQILAIQPRHADSLHLLGVIGYQAGHHGAAAELIRKAIAMNDRDASYHCNLGSVLQALSKLDEAVTSYGQALKLSPDHAEAHNNLGNVLQSLGRLHEAASHYEKALAVKPEEAQTHNNLANTLQALSRPDEAVAHYTKALDLSPDYAEAHNNFGNTLQTLGRLDGALAHYGQALTLKPHYPEAHNNLGNALDALGKVDEAVAHYEQALALWPDYAEAHNNLGNSLRGLGRLDQAVAHCEQALILNPAYAEAHNNLGICLQDLGRLDEAVASYSKALALSPNYAEAHMNLGNALQLQGKLVEAVACYEQAITLSPDYAQAHMNKALTQLARGDFASGWRSHEWRWGLNKPSSPNPNFLEPQWHGEPLNGDRILLHAEQGLGDCIQFLRYLPMVRAAGGAIVLEVPAALRRIAARLPDLAELIVSGEPRPSFDWHCPLMSLPLAFGTNLGTIPAQVPYLPIPQEAQTGALALPRTAEGLRVGLAWAGNPKHLKDRSRSIPFPLFEPLLQVTGVNFFSLQVGKAAEQLFASNAKITDLAPAVVDMADTAAQIAQLDLVISVDTSVAHLTGALGKPLWLLLSSDADWRWLMQREDKPWYPTARLFRQATFGDWKGVIDRAASLLASSLHHIGPKDRL